MRRPHVYERSSPRPKRDYERERGTDYKPVARLAAERLPELLREAETCGAIVLARYLGQALTEAEDILSQAPPDSS